MSCIAGRIVPESDRPDAPERRPTIRDVAERAGVSKSLVSLVLHDSPKVSSKSRAAVLKAIDELGYRPSAIARSLVSGRSNTIGVVISDPHHDAHSTVMEGIHTATASAALKAIVMFGEREVEREREIVNTFLGLRVDGLIFLGSVLPIDQLEDLGKQLPVAVVGRRMPADAVDVIMADSRVGAAKAVEHLIELGHHNIGHIDATLSKAEPECLAGYRDAMEAHGLTPNVVPGSLTREGGESGARMLLEQDEFPTAIFVASDLAALGAREVIQSAGLSVPDRVSIVGYDDSPFASLPDIDLTSIREPLVALGIYAAEVVANRIHDPTEPPQQWIAEPELVARGSTRAPVGSSISG
jgi:DNA-binding LacI/PurR family transcriptional regulator